MFLEILYKTTFWKKEKEIVSLIFILLLNISAHVKKFKLFMSHFHRLHAFDVWKILKLYKRMHESINVIRNVTHIYPTFKFFRWQGLKL